VVWVVLKVAVIGTGSISKSHTLAYLKNPNVEVVGVFDYNIERATDYAKSFNTQAFETLDQLLASKDIDAVSICTWNNSHADLSIKALKANKHVLVEKPVALNTEQAKQIQHACQQSDRVFQIGYVRRAAMNSQVLKRFIDGGTLGEIYYAKATALRRLGNPGGWFADKTRSGGGPLIDIGVHLLDICWYLMGKPKPIKITGHKYNKLGNRSHIEGLSFYKAADYDASLNTVEDLANAVITFENGASLMLDVSFTLHAEKDIIQIELFGTEGGATLEPSLKIYTEQFNTIVNITPQIDHPTFDFTGAFQNEIDAFVESCLFGKPSLAPIEDGVVMMSILDAIYDSAKTGNEVLVY